MALEYRHIGFSWWYIPATLVFALLDYKWAGPSGGILEVLLGGIEVIQCEESGGEILPFPMGRWLFVFGWLFLTAGLYSIRARRLFVLELYRYGSFGRWWLKQCLRIQGMSFILYMEMVLVWYVLELMTGRKTEEAGWILLTFGLHAAVLVAVEICLNLLAMKGMAAGILIIAEGMGYVLAEQTGNPWLAGGMFVRSSRYIENGFSLSVMYSVEILLLVFCYTAIWRLERSGRLENRLFGKEE
ncbi:MAG: hypothetical protein K2K56_02705 [Lachnospiraceae bacterium]|nr:hypothetical protein [Lachnospiraceae bacterium]